MNYYSSDSIESVNWILKDAKNCYLLNMNEAVIGLCRILLEVACRAIYEGNGRNIKQLSYMDKGKKSVGTIIREACKVKGFYKKEIKEVLNKYGKPSDILHGKVSAHITDEETLSFVRDVFSIIEKLY